MITVAVPLYYGKQCKSVSGQAIECRMGAGDRIEVAITGAYIFAFICDTYNIPTARTITWLYSSHREEAVVRFEDASALESTRTCIHHTMWMPDDSHPL